MIPNAARAKEVLYDSETVLRMIDHQLSEWRDPAEAHKPPDLLGFLAVLRHASNEIAHVLATLRNSRAALEGVAIDRLHESAAKIREVSNATEAAATDIMNGLDRAHQLVDQLEALDSASTPGSETVADVCAELRAALSGMLEPLQFQDITTQQLSHVSTMLADVEGRLQMIASMLGGGKVEGDVPMPDEKAYAESASTSHASDRQGEADALFAPSEPKVAS